MRAIIPILLLLAMPLMAAKKIKIPAPNQFGIRPKTVVYLPKEKKTNLPLVILLHGHGANGSIQNLYFALHRWVDRLGFIIASPTGTKDSEKHRFWNDGYLDLDFLHKHKGVMQPQTDDIGFIDNLITTMIGRYQIDPSRIFLVGHSNGAFMSYRYACAGKYPVNTIVPVAGGISNRQTSCNRNFSIIHIHGTKDPIIKYAGNQNYYSVDDNLEYWAAHNQCSLAPTVANEDNFLLFKIGHDTTIYNWNDCKSGKQITLWKLNNANHIPFFNKNWRKNLLMKLLNN